LGGAQGQPGWIRKILHPPGFETWTVHPLPSRHTNHAILATYKSPGIDQILEEMIEIESEVLCCNVDELICSIKKKLPQPWKKFLIVPICKMGDKRESVIY
jgi:hypothetical protein